MEEKKEKQFLPDSFQKVICHNTKFQPYLNAFHFKGENFDKQKLGEIFGVIQILDHSENSAYIPNLIAQVIKKEFYSNYKRITSKSFEAALHKANLALADLAQHEIIEWIGKMNAVIGVIKNEELHFTQAGGGKILLLRNKTLNDISKGLDAGEGIGHPIKTFSNISSGDIELEDKLIFSSESAFESIRLDELKRHSKTFKSAEFDNIVNSTLDLEAENAALILVNIIEKPLSINSQKKDSAEKQKLDKNANYFGTAKEDNEKDKEESTDNEDDSNNIDKKEKTEKKLAKNKEEKPLSKAQALAAAEAKIEEAKDKNKKEEKNTTKEEEEEPLSKAQALAAAEAKIEKIKEKDEKEVEKEIDQRAIAEYYNSDDNASPFEEEPEVFIKAKDVEKEEAELEKEFKESKVSFFESVKNFLEKTWDYSKELSVNYREKIVKIKQGAKNTKKQNIKIDSLPSNELREISAPEKKEQTLISITKEKIGYYSKTFLTVAINKSKKIAKKIIRKTRTIDFKKLSNLSHFKNNLKLLKKIDWKNKWVIGFIILIFVIFLIIIIKPEPQDDIPKNEIITEQPSLLEKPTLEKETEPINLKSISQINEKLTSTTSINNNLYFLTENNYFLKLDHQSNKLTKIDLPDYVKKIKTITAIPSLQLVFLVNLNSVYSYSPVTERFYDNQISLPENFENQSSDVYLTYIYLLDKNQNQIFQYPRATGGFGEVKKWLRDDSDLTSAVDIAIDNSIYTVFEDGHIDKFFQGKKQNDFNLQQTDPVIFADRIRGNVESENLFILDSKNQRIIEINKQGNIINQFQDKKFLGAQNLWVDFDQKIIYIIGSKGEILSFNYN